MKTLRIAGILASFSLLASCASSAMPPKLTKSQATTLSERPLPYSVGVEVYKHPAYSQKLARTLEDCGAFEEVMPLSEFTRPPDLIATVEEPVHGNAVIPALTFASLGLVPTIVEERHGLRFALAPASNPKCKRQIDATYRGTTTLGWAAIPINLSPGYTGGDPDSGERFQRLLAYKAISALQEP